MSSVPSAPNSITIERCHTRAPYPSDSVPMGLGGSGMSDSELGLSIHIIDLLALCLLFDPYALLGVSGLTSKGRFL